MYVLDRAGLAMMKTTRIALWLGVIAAVLALCVIIAQRVYGEDIPRQVTSMHPMSGQHGDKVVIVCAGVLLQDVRDIEFSGDTASVVSSSKKADQLELSLFVPAKAQTGMVRVVTRKARLDAGIFTINSAMVAVVTTATNDGAGANPVGGGTGAATAPGRLGAPGFAPPAIDRDIDLPIEPPVFGSKPNTPPTPPPPPYVPPPPPPPPTIYGKDLKSESSSLIYVIDISGSMGWDMGQYTAPDGQTKTGCRLDRAKAELTKSIVSLPKTFKFNLESYDCSVYVCFSDIGTSQMPLVDADDEHKNKAIAWIGELKPQGATGTGPAVVNALQPRQNKLVILLTDGAPNCGAGDEMGGWPCMQAHLSQIRYGNAQHATINVFGIGATGEFKQFCMNVAAENGGSYTDVR